MLLEVDGMARAGKTSLIRAIESSQLAYTRKLVRPLNPVAEMYHTHVPLASAKEWWALDRGHGTEWVMTQLTGRKTPYSDGEFWALDDLFAILGVTIVYVEAPDSVLIDRMTKTNREPEGDLCQLRALWEEFLRATGCHVIRLDGSQPTPTIFVQLLENLLSTYSKEHFDAKVQHRLEHI